MDSDHTTSDVKQAVDDISYEKPQLSRSERIETTYNEWMSESNIKSQRKIAKQYDFSSSTLNDRIKGANSWAERAQKLQRIWPEEKTIMIETIERLQSWNWFARVQHVRFMAEQLLIARDDRDSLDKYHSLLSSSIVNASTNINWIHKFMTRHKHLISKYVSPLNKNRVMAQSSAILGKWFDLFQRYRTLYKIKNDNIYNMNEKNFLQNVIAKLRIIISKHEINQLITQSDNREWTFLIECVSMTGRKLRPWIIFKEVVFQKIWIDVYSEAHFTCSENDWINNEIDLLWLQICFDVKTVTIDDEYRILIVNGHASHISTKIIEFCVQKRIILLCFPAHITHILQSLDVGVFASLSTTYKNDLHAMTQYEADYAIDKVDFLEVFKPAREKAMTISNIEGAYAKASLESFNSQPILHEYRDRENPALNIESSSTHYSIIFTISSSSDFLVEVTIICTSSNGEIRNVVMTLHNSLQMKKLLKQTLNMSQNADRIAQKVDKSALHAFASATLMIDQTEQLMILVSKKKFKKKRKKGALQGARCMNQEVLDERRLNWDWNSACKRLDEIHLNVFDLTRKKTHEKRVARRETIKSKQLAKIKIIVSSTKKQFAVAASSAKREDLITISAKKTAKEIAKETFTKRSNAKTISIAEKNITTANNELVARSTKRSDVSTKKKRKKLLMSLPIRVNNQNLERERWKRKKNDLIDQPLGQGQRQRRPSSRM